MAEPFVGEIQMFAGTFAPRGWALCDGQLLAIAQYNALFSLLGTYYGGDGRTTFGLPDLRGRVPVHQGTGAGLTNRRIGSEGGQENVTLTVNELPSHTHALPAQSEFANQKAPAGNVPAKAEDGEQNYSSGSADTSLSPTDTVGNYQQHTNLQPTTCVNFIIALVGIYPSRN